jgi:hypothetical protein
VIPLTYTNPTPETRTTSFIVDTLDVDRVGEAYTLEVTG